MIGYFLAVAQLNRGEAMVNGQGIGGLAVQPAAFPPHKSQRREANGDDIDGRMAT
jgi:hypothetical protein